MCCCCCRACVRFRFLQRPEYITPGTRFVFREGRTKVRNRGGAAHCCFADSKIRGVLILFIS
jgi:hypothetical protein